MRRKRFRTTRRLSRRPEASSSAEASTEARSRWSNEPEASRWSTSRTPGGASEVRRLVLEIALRERIARGQCALGVFQRRGRVRRRLRRGWRVRRGAGGARRLAEGDDRASPDADARANPRRGDARARGDASGGGCRATLRATHGALTTSPRNRCASPKTRSTPSRPAGRSARGATHRRLKSPRRRFGRVTPIEAPRPTASLANIGSVVRSFWRARRSLFIPFEMTRMKGLVLEEMRPLRLAPIGSRDDSVDVSVLKRGISSWRPHYDAGAVPLATFHPRALPR